MPQITATTPENDSPNPITPRPLRRWSVAALIAGSLVRPDHEGSPPVAASQHPRARTSGTIAAR